MDAAPNDDLSPLAWVHGELKRSLDNANKALRRYLKEAEAAGGSDIDAVDPSVLRTARAQLHQGVGALELVGLPAVADVLRASEAAVQRLAAKPSLVTAEAVETVERVSFALLDFLARQLAGKPVSPVLLFPQYRGAMQLAGADRVHPADLWKTDWQWHALPADARAAAANCDEDARGRMEALVLALMRQPAHAGAEAAGGPQQQMSDLCADLAAGARFGLAPGAERQAAFWQLAAAVYEAQSQGLLEPDVFVKRLASRLLAQLRMRVKGDAEVSERLAQDLLFFCSHAKAPALAATAPRLAAVRRAWRLEQLPTADYEHVRLGRHDPALLTLARKRVAAARDTWSAVAGGESHRIQGLVEQFSLVGESLQRLVPEGDLLGRMLTGAAQQTAGSGAAPPAALAMEVATAILYLDATFEDAELDNPELAPRVRRLAERVEAVRAGAEPQPLDLWMEELYRRVSDRQTMGSVVAELRGSLSEIEKQIDQYFRDPSQRQVLIPVPAQLSAMRGVLSVLGLTQASQAALHMRDDVDALAQTEVDPQRAVQAGTFDRLADNLGALSFLIDMLAVQPAMAKSLFRFDPETARLSAVMGQTERASAFAAFDDTAPLPTSEPDTAPLVERLRTLAMAAQDGTVADAALAQQIEPLAQQALAADQSELSRLLAGAARSLRTSADAAVRNAVRAELAEALTALAEPPAPPPAPAPAPLPPEKPAAAVAPGDSGLEDDAEMREIFIEEAREVIADARAALERLGETPENGADMTAVRRAFHTLKGSSRMVGLKDFGEAAWAFEQLYNARLAQNESADLELRELSVEALDYLADWADAIDAGAARGHGTAAVAQAADAMRLDGRRERIERPAGAGAPATAPLPAAAPWAREPEAVTESGLGAPAPAQPVPLSELGVVDPDLQLVFEEPEPAEPAGPGQMPGHEPEHAMTGVPPEPSRPAVAEPAASTEPAPEPPESLPPPDALAEILPPPPEAAAEPMPAAPPERALEPLAESFTGFTEASAEILPELPPLPESLEPEPGPEPTLPPAETATESVDAFFDLPTPELVDLTEAPVLAELEMPLDAGAPAPGAAPPAAADELPMPLPDLVVEFDAERTEPLPTPDAASQAAESTDLDLPFEPEAAFELPELTLPLPLRDEQPAAPAEAAEGLDFDLDLGPEPAPAGPAELPSLADRVPDLPSAADLDLAGADAVPARAEAVDFGFDLAAGEALPRVAADTSAPPPDLPALDDAIEAPLLHDEVQAPAAEPVPEPVSLLSDEDEQVKVIGPLRISIPLFNIYLNEADELSRRLGTELAEWAADPERREVPEHSAALAHGLAGSSATVGFAELSALARALEHALLRSHAAGAGRPERAGEPALFNDAADEIRRLLHQFAAGFLRPVSPELMARLAEHERLPMPEPALDDTADLDAEDGSSMHAERALPSRLAALPEGDADDIDAVDAIDAELLPIFEEEADELLPQLQARLREWLHRPGEQAAAMACMRTLHTIKGGARLAGAMRLGEMAHRMETGIEALLARGEVYGHDVEPLVARADAMSAVFERLRHPQPEPAAAAPAAPAAVEPTAPQAALEAAVEPVLEDAPAAPDEAAAADAARAAPEAEPAPEPEPETEPGTPGLAGPALPASAALPAAAAAPVREIDWARFHAEAMPQLAAAQAAAEPAGRGAGAVVRVKAGLLDRMVNQAGEVSITRARLDADVRALQGHLSELTDSLERMRRQLRDIELQAETQIASRMEAARASAQGFDPLEMDRFTRLQELTRFMAESVNDVATLQRSLQRTLQSTEDQLAAQARLTRELQDDLLRTRMVEFESLADRLYRTARQASRDTGKPVRLDIVGGGIEIDRGVLERMAGPFEHLLRNSVAHGIEPAAVRSGAGKDAAGALTITVAQAGNEVAVEFADDGAGLDFVRIRERAIARGLLAPEAAPGEDELAALIFQPGFSTAEQVTELAGRGVGMDVVRSEVAAMGGRVETRSESGRGTRFRLLLPLTTAVTQVVMLRCGEVQVAVPSPLIEIVRRVPTAEVERAYEQGQLEYNGEALPFFWLAALLQGAPTGETPGRSQTVVVVRSAAQRVAVHVDEVVGNQEVVVKNVGAQLSRLPGLAGVTLLPSGAAALIYNPVALAALYGEAVGTRAREAVRSGVLQAAHAAGIETAAVAAATRTPLVLVVDDSLTVRRVTQRLLVREGYRVVLAKDGLEALERLAEERPAVLLSDIEMPRMDGFDLARNVRADPALAGLPIVMITSRIAQKHRDYAAELGVDHYLGKPYSEEELLGLVARYAGADIPA